MDNLLIIRATTSDDISIIRAIADDVWPKTYQAILGDAQVRYMMDLFYSEDSLRSQLKEHHFVLAFDGDQPIGFASFGPTSKPAVYKLHKLYVRQATQTRGVGRSIIRHIIDELRILNAAALMLNVNRQNNAKAFYERLGFQTVGTEDIDIGNGFFMNDYIMRFEINHKQ